MLAIQSESRSAGQDRFEQMAMYAAESGTAAGMEYLRNNCSPTALFSAFVQPNNVDPLSPSQILGNNIRSGASGNPFAQSSHSSYSVTLLNNKGDSGLASGDDTDGQIILRVVGYGPNQTQVTLELEVYSESCLSSFCEQEYAQRGINSRNDAIAACSQQVDPAAAARTFTPN